MKRVIMIGICAVVGLVHSGGTHAQQFYYDRNGDTVSVVACDSLIMVKFKFTGQTEPGPGQFAAAVGGLSDSYTPWEWTDDYWIFGLDSSVTADSAISILHSRDEVGIVNPVLEGGANRRVWMTDALIVRFKQSVTPTEI